MTSAREALVSLRAATQLLSRSPTRLPERPASAKTVETLRAAEAGASEPSGDVLKSLRARLVAAFTKPGAVPAARADLRDAPWLLWTARDPLANLRGLLDAIWMQARWSKRTRKNLIEAWIRDFALNRPDIARGGESIRRLLISNPNPRFDFWSRLDRRLELFDAQIGPRSLASRLMQGPESVYEILQMTGFDDPLRAVGGYTRSVQSIALTLASSALRTPSSQDALTRLTTFLAPSEGLRFEEPQSRGEIARGLLAPWLDGGHEPGDPIRDGVRTFLLRKLGDPRLRAENWQPVGLEATNLMRRWLARMSLKAFFDLIADHALDAHWKYREAFWTACLNCGGIDDAWLALGSRVHISARAVRELNGAYARLEGAAVEAQQSILLLKVRNIVFCEWSHNGKLRAWFADGKGAPRLNQSTYTREDVNQIGLPFPQNPQFGSRGAPDGTGLSHINSDRDYWQSSAAELLAQRCGIKLTPSEWKLQ